MKKYLFLIFICSVFTGCAAIETEHGALNQVPGGKPGIYHKAKPSETLWLISKTYNVSVADLMKANSIPSGATLEENQLVFIPGAFARRDIVSVPEKLSTEFLWPIHGRILKNFNEINSVGIASKGIDIDAQEGMFVKAARSGQVVFADYLLGYGYTLIVDHLDGYYSVYAQNQKLLAVLGEFVKKGQAVAEVGRQGNLAFAHFEIRQGAKADNPANYLP